MPSLQYTKKTAGSTQAPKTTKSQSSNNDDYDPENTDEQEKQFSWFTQINSVLEEYTKSQNSMNQVLVPITEDNISKLKFSAPIILSEFLPNYPGKKTKKHVFFIKFCPEVKEGKQIMQQEGIYVSYVDPWTLPWWNSQIRYLRRFFKSMSYLHKSLSEVFIPTSSIDFANTYLLNKKVLQ